MIFSSPLVIRQTLLCGSKRSSCSSKRHTYQQLHSTGRLSQKWHSHWQAALRRAATPCLGEKPCRLLKFLSLCSISPIKSSAYHYLHTAHSVWCIAHKLLHSVALGVNSWLLLGGGSTSVCIIAVGHERVNVQTREPHGCQWSEYDEGSASEKLDQPKDIFGRRAVHLPGQPHDPRLSLAAV